MKSRDKTDELVRETLEGTLEPLSDLSRARIGTNVLAALDGKHPLKEATIQPSIRRRFARGSILVAGAAACLAVGWWFGSSNESGSELSDAQPERSDPSQSATSDPTATAATNVPTSDQQNLGETSENDQTLPGPPPPARVVRALAGETIEVQVGKAELTLFGPGQISITTTVPDGPQTIRVVQGTVVSAANGEPIVLTNGDAKQAFVGPLVAIRVERGTVVASASSERAVKRVFSVEFDNHRRLRAEGPNLADAQPTKIAVKTPKRPKSSLAAKNLNGTSSPTIAPTLEEVVEKQAETDSETTDAKAKESAAIYADAEQAMERGKLAVAAELLERVVALFPDSPDAVVAAFDLALLSYRAGNFGEAIVRLDAMLVGKPTGAVYNAARLLRCRAVASRDGRDGTVCLEKRP